MKNPRRAVWNEVRRSLESDALKASQGEVLAQAVEHYLANPAEADTEQLRAALQSYRRATAQPSGPIST